MVTVTVCHPPNVQPPMGVVKVTVSVCSEGSKVPDRGGKGARSQVGEGRKQGEMEHEGKREVRRR